MLRKSLAAFAGVAAASTGLLLNTNVTQTESGPDKKGYVPRFLDETPDRFKHMETGAKIPDKAIEDRRVSNRNKTLSYVSSLGNLLMDITRDEGASPFMDMAVEEACEGIIKGEGGPFGAVVVRDGFVVARAHNTVLQTNDPTAHAEVTCIRKASARLGRFDLSDCIMYSSCEPCPMCYGAIHWAKIPKCYYAATAQDAAAAGFDDKFIYDAIRNEAKEVYCEFIHKKHMGAVDVFKADYSLY